MTPVTILIDTPAKRDRAVTWLAKIPVDQTMELTLKPYKRSRSDEQNRRYWKLIGLIADKTGHDKDELHDLFKNRFLGKKEIELQGSKYLVPQNSRNLKVVEFADFMTQVENWAIDTLGVWLE